MRAQGLSVSFVVVAALAILVLVLGVAFLMGAFGSQKQTAQISQIKQTCNSWCNDMANNIAVVDCTTGKCTGDLCVANHTWSSYIKYCNTTFNVGGQKETCNEITSCTVSDSLGNSIVVTCDNKDYSNAPSCG